MESGRHPPTRFESRLLILSHGKEATYPIPIFVDWKVRPKTAPARREVRQDGRQALPGEGGDVTRYAPKNKQQIICASGRQGDQNVDKKLQIQCV